MMTLLAILWAFHPDTAQYKNTDYANAVRVERNITLEEAIAIAENDPEIAYFCYTKGYSMVLEIEDETSVKDDPLLLVKHHPQVGSYRHFLHGDTLFFKDKAQMWLGSAPSLSDTWVKEE